MKNPTGSPETYKKLAEISYSKDAGSVAVDIADTVKNARLIEADIKAVPLTFVVSGIVLLAVVIFMRRKRDSEHPFS